MEPTKPHDFTDRKLQSTATKLSVSELRAERIHRAAAAMLAHPETVQVENDECAKALAVEAARVVDGVDAFLRDEQEVSQ